MLSRRHLRTKVLQALYAYFQSGDHQIDQGEKQLLLSINKLHELFIYQLSFLIETARYAEKRLEEGRRKHLPTAEDLNPNMRFAEMQLLARIDENKEFRRMEKLYRINWSQEQDLIRKFYNLIRESDDFERYMSAEKTGFAAEKKFLATIAEKYFSIFDLLQSFYEEKSIYFVDDYHLVTYLVVKFFKGIEDDFGPESQLPPLLKSETEDENEDLDFVKKLFRETVMHSDEYGQLIAATTQNWEQDRIAIMDMIILKMALAELVSFPSIPVKVTMNEYIDISKYFSTARSKVFVNGVLDKLIHDFRAGGKIVKTGRGLLDD
jgi:N utilization substance protein B